MARKEIDATWDRLTRNNLNDNFMELYSIVNNLSEDVLDLSPLITEENEPWEV